MEGNKSGTKGNPKQKIKHIRMNLLENNYFCDLKLTYPHLYSRHIKEHLEGKVDPTAHMTPEQLQFHYFNMHDLDKNGKLDGVELIKAITHFHQGKY